MYEIVFSPAAQKDLRNLSHEINKRISKKLKFYSNSPNFLSFAKPLTNLPRSTHRFRIGKYRVLFHLEKNIIFIDRIEIRSQAYRQY